MINVTAEKSPVFNHSENFSDEGLLTFKETAEYLSIKPVSILNQLYKITRKQFPIKPIKRLANLASEQFFARVIGL